MFCNRYNFYNILWNFYIKLLYTKNITTELERFEGTQISLFHQSSIPAFSPITGVHKFGFLHKLTIKLIIMAARIYFLKDSDCQIPSFVGPQP